MLARVFRFSALYAIVVSLSLYVALPCRAYASSRLVNETEGTQEEEKAAGRFDVFGDLRDCDLGARLDNFAIQLMNEAKTMKGHAIVYSGKYDLPQRVLAYRGRIGDYLVNSRGLEPSRLTVVDGGYREEMTVELWLVPKGAPVPEPSGTIDATKELDKAFKFQEQYIYLPELSAEVEDFESVVEVADESAIGEAGVDEQPVEEQTDAANASGQNEEAQEVSVEAEEEPAGADEDVLWILKDYARALHIEEKARGHIIFYADREKATFSKVQAVIEQALAQLAGKYGVKAERLTVVFGGYRQQPAVELWLVPVNVSLPVPTPEPEEKEDELKNRAAATTAQQPTAP